MKDSKSQKKKYDMIIDDIRGLRETFRKDIAAKRQAIRFLSETEENLILTRDSVPLDTDWYRVHPIASTTMRMVDRRLNQLHETVKYVRRKYDSPHRFTQLLPSYTMVAASGARAIRALNATAMSFAVEDNPELAQPLQKLRNPSLRQTRDQLLQRLESIDQRIAGKIRDAWDHWEDTSIEEPHMAAAHAMREAFSHLLDVLAPNDLVIKAPWWKQDPNAQPGQATRRQRVRFAIAGERDDTQIPEKIIDAIEQSQKEAVKLYNHLSKLSHPRQRRVLTETIIDIYQRMMLDILRLREELSSLES